MRLLLLAQVITPLTPPVPETVPDASMPFLTQVWPILWTLATLAVIWLGMQGGRWLSARAQANKLALVGERLWAVASGIVAHVGVGMKPKFASMMADGKINAAEAHELKAEAMRLIKEGLGVHGLAEVRKVFGLETGAALDVFLSGLVERALGAQKAIHAATPPPVRTVTRAPATPPTVPTVGAPTRP